MALLKWGEGPRLFEQGVDRGVLYLRQGAVSWDGLVAVDEKATGFVNTDHYFDGNRIHVSQETGVFEATVSAYTYPDVFNEYNGYSEQETYRRFGFSYRTQHGDGYKIHLVYDVLVRDDTREWSTDSDRPDPSLFNWDIFGEDVSVPGASSASHLILDVALTGGHRDALEDILYGTETTEPRLPSPEELIESYESLTSFRVTYNQDGTYTITAPDDMLVAREDGSFDVDSPSAYLLDQNLFVVSSY